MSFAEMQQLIIMDEDGQTSVVPLLDDEVRIGRAEGNTIHLPDRNISRHHARLVREGRDLYIEDLSSYNGVQKNGERILGRAELSDGDWLQLGDYQMTLRDGARDADMDTPRLLHRLRTTAGRTSLVLAPGTFDALDGPLDIPELDSLPLLPRARPTLSLALRLMMVVAVACLGGWGLHCKSVGPRPPPSATQCPLNAHGSLAGPSHCSPKARAAP